MPTQGWRHIVERCLACEADSVGDHVALPSRRRGTPRGREGAEKNLASVPGVSWAPSASRTEAVSTVSDRIGFACEAALHGSRSPTLHS